MGNSNEYLKHVLEKGEIKKNDLNTLFNVLIYNFANHPASGKDSGADGRVLFPHSHGFRLMGQAWFISGSTVYPPTTSAWLKLCEIILKATTSSPLSPTKKDHFSYMD